MEERRKPIRTCIGCRIKKEKKKLLRIVCTEEGFRIDERGVLPGRGAYLCDDSECLKKAVRTRAMNRVYRKSFSEDSYRRLEEEFGIGKRKENSR